MHKRQKYRSCKQKDKSRGKRPLPVYKRYNGKQSDTREKDLSVQRSDVSRLHLLNGAVELILQGDIDKAMNLYN